MSNPKLNKDHVEVRCMKCDKLLAKNNSLGRIFEVKCTRCGTLNSIFEKMNDQVIITDSEGVILYTNDAIESITGYSQEEVIGNKPSLWGGQMPKEFYEKMWDTIKNKKESITVRLKNKRKDGTFYNAELRITPVFNSKGESQFYIGIETVINS